MGDNLHVFMRHIARTVVKELIDHLKNPNTSQIWYADDSAACGTLIDLKSWWLSLSRWGPSFGYFPNNKKTTLFVKSEYYNEAINWFHGTNIRISTEGAMYLGGPIVSELFVGQVMEKKISEWCVELSNLSRAAAIILTSAMPASHMELHEVGIIFFVLLIFRSHLIVLF